MSIKSVFSWVAIVLAIGCIAMFTWSLAVYTVDVPVLDDFTTMFEFPLQYETLSNTLDKVKLVLSRHGLMEHRLGTMRMLILLQYKLTGNINFYELSWAGNIFVYILAGFLAVVFAWLKKSYVYFLPIIFLIFQAQLFPFGILWCNSALLYVPVSFLSLAIFYLLIEPTTRRFITALVLMIISLYTFSNGLFVMIIAPLLLLAQRRWRETIILFVFEGILATAYLSDYHKSDATQTPSPALLGAYVRNFFAFLGGLFDFGTDAHKGLHLAIPIAAGVVVMSLFVLIFLRLLHGLWPSIFRQRFSWLANRLPTNEATFKLDLFLVSVFLYLFITALALSIFRIQDSNDTDTLFRSRYKINSALFMVVAYMSCLSLLPSRSVRYVSVGWIVVTLLLSAYSFFWTSRLIQYDRDRYNHAAFNYRHNGWWGMFPEVMPFEKFAKDVTDELLPYHLYRFPTLYYSPYEQSMLMQPIRAIAPNDAIPLTTTETNDEFTLNNQTVGPLYSGSNGQCIVLKSNQHTYLFAVQPRLNDRKKWLVSGQPFTNGFVSHLPKAIIAPGTYRIGLFRLVDGKPSLTYTPYQITDV